MKTRLLLTSTFLTGALLVLNAQNIPNSNFEDWSNGPNNAPDGWIDHGSNHIGFYPASQTTNHYFGSYAVMLQNLVNSTDTTGGVISTARPGGADGFGPAFPVNIQHSTLKGFYKFAPQNNDSTQIIVYLTKTGYSHSQGYGNLLAWGQGELPAAAVYTPFSVGCSVCGTSTFYYDNASLTPDSAYIEISAFKKVGMTMYDLKPLGNSVLYVDAIKFDTYATGINNNLSIANNLTLYPNSNNGNFNVNFETQENAYTKISVYDLNGKLIVNLFDGNLSRGKHNVNYALPEISNGNYIFVISSAKGYTSTNLLIQK